MTPPRAEACVRHYRLAVIVVVGAPWLVVVTSAIASDWRLRGGAIVVSAMIDLALVIFAVRRPGGVATWLILIRLVFGIIPALRMGGAWGIAAAAFNLVSAAALVALIALMWEDIRQARVERLQVRRGDALSPGERRRALKRQARIERDGYL